MNRRELFKSIFGLGFLSRVHPTYDNFDDEVGTNIRATDSPVTLLAATPGVAWTVTQVSLQVAGLFSSLASPQSGRLAVWFDTSMDNVHTLRFVAPIGDPNLDIGVAAYPPIWEHPAKGPIGSAVKTGWLIDGAGGLKGGQLAAGWGTIRITYQQT